MRFTLPLCLLLGCATTKSGITSPPFVAVALPGATTDGVLMDFLAYEPAHDRIWVPAGNTGSVDVIETATHFITRVEGFATATVERNGKSRVIGPSSVTVGDGAVYVGNRADSTVCRIDAGTLRVGGCVTLDVPADGLAYVASLHEVWVTCPRDKSIRILDASTPQLAERAKLTFDTEPEGFAVDEAHGLFFTNLEDHDVTLAIDLATRKTKETWHTQCGNSGPKGLAFDRALDFLLVACSHSVNVLDAGHGGTVLGTVETGDGLDNIDYVEGRHEVFAAAGGAATLTVARLEPNGQLVPLTLAPTAKGSRTVVATEKGLAFVTDGVGGRILIVGAAH